MIATIGADVSRIELRDLTELTRDQEATETTLSPSPPALRLAEASPSADSP